MSKRDALLVLLLLLIAPASAGLQTEEARVAPLIVDHTATDLSVLPGTAIELAKQDLHIVYGHTSHGSQLTTGMTGLASFTHAPYPGSVYAWNKGGTGGALDLDEQGVWNDLGNPDFISWSTMTRNYLNSHPLTNVVIWSWCGELSWATSANVDTYLSLMDTLEADYPDVAFVYMTGHLDGTGVAGNLNQRNNQIRQFCRTHNKVLYDFADIESYDPDGNEYLSRNADDGCNYNGGNWATIWQDGHAEGVDWYQCSAAHTEPLNANRKAYAAWNLWARLAGWQAGQVPVTTTTVSPTVIPSVHQVPGIIQAEDYDTGGEGFGYSDTTPTNLGGAYRTDGVDIERITGSGTGYALCYVRDGEWTRYTLNVTTPGIYRVDLTVSSPEAGRSVSLLRNGTELGRALLPQTGSFDTYGHATGEVSLPAGRSLLILRFNGDGQNLDSFSLTRVGQAPLPGQATAPLDPDHDGLCEDLNGNGYQDFSDVVLFFNQLDWIAENEPVGLFDFNNNGMIDFNDVVLLFGRL